MITNGKSGHDDSLLPSFALNTITKGVCVQIMNVIIFHVIARRCWQLISACRIDKHTRRADNDILLWIDESLLSVILFCIFFCVCGFIKRLLFML